LLTSFVVSVDLSTPYLPYLLGNYKTERRHFLHFCSIKIKEMLRIDDKDIEIVLGHPDHREKATVLLPWSMFPQPVAGRTQQIGSNESFRKIQEGLCGTKKARIQNSNARK
jgi:hypothetical protein